MCPWPRQALARTRGRAGCPSGGTGGGSGRGVHRAGVHTAVAEGPGLARGWCHSAQGPGPWDSGGKPGAVPARGLHTLVATPAPDPGPGACWVPIGRGGEAFRAACPSGGRAYRRCPRGRIVRRKWCYRARGPGPFDSRNPGAVPGRGRYASVATAVPGPGAGAGAGTKPYGAGAPAPGAADAALARRRTPAPFAAGSRDRCGIKAGKVAHAKYGIVFGLVVCRRATRGRGRAALPRQNPPQRQPEKEARLLSEKQPRPKTRCIFSLFFGLFFTLKKAVGILVTFFSLFHGVPRLAFFSLFYHF